MEQLLRKMMRSAIISIVDDIRNIKELMDESTTDLWGSFSKRANATENTLFDMLHIQIPLKKTYFVKMHLTYFVELRTVVALFDTPKLPGRASEMTYLNAFLKSENFEVIVDQSGIICDVNEMHTEFFNKSRDYFIGKKFDLLIKLFSDYNENSLHIYRDTKDAWLCRKSKML